MEFLDLGQFDFKTIPVPQVENGPIEDGERQADQEFHVGPKNGEADNNAEKMVQVLKLALVLLQGEFQHRGTFCRFHILRLAF